MSAEVAEAVEAAAAAAAAAAAEYHACHLRNAPGVEKLSAVRDFPWCVMGVCGAFTAQQAQQSHLRAVESERC